MWQYIRKRFPDIKDISDNIAINQFPDRENSLNIKKVALEESGTHRKWVWIFAGVVPESDRLPKPDFQCFLFFMCNLFVYVGK